MTANIAIATTEPNDDEKLQYEMRFLTPAFLGDAEQNGPLAHAADQGACYASGGGWCGRLRHGFRDDVPTHAAGGGVAVRSAARDARDERWQKVDSSQEPGPAEAGSVG